MSGPVAEGGGGVYRSRDEGETWTWEGAGLGSGVWRSVLPPE